MKNIRELSIKNARKLTRAYMAGVFYISRNIDFLRYRNRLLLCLKQNKTESNDRTKGLLIASGRGMNIVWAQIWTFLAMCAKQDFPRVYVITTAKRQFIHKYFKLLGAELIRFDVLIERFDREIPQDLFEKIARAKNSNDYRNIYFASVPIGDIALSTFCRHRGIGKIDNLDSEERQEIQTWMLDIYKSYQVTMELIKNLDISHSFHTEVFLEEYGGIFFGCLEKNVKVVRFAGTVRDDAFIIQKLSNESARKHHASLNSSKWLELSNAALTEDMANWISTNFKERYSDKWFRSKRNYPGIQIEDENLIFEELSIRRDKPIAIVFSHVLYDSIYFYGTDLYPDYETWLIETVRQAIDNPNVQWIIKLHPSNVWRGEVETLLKGKTLEEQIISSHFPELPRHVQIMKSDSKISTYALMEIANYGITVRGTAGLEMATLGKQVITAGTGRYEDCGFTIDPKTVKEYEEIISNLHQIGDLGDTKQLLARKYAYGIFALKAYEISSLKPCLSFGRSSMVGSDDVCYLPSQDLDLPSRGDIANFLEFLMDDRSDLYSRDLASEGM